MSTTKPNPIPEHELENQYAESLRECYGEVVQVAGYEYDTALVLKEIDPVAYRCGFADWISAELDERLIEVAGEYYKRNEWNEYQETLSKERDDETR